MENCPIYWKGTLEDEAAIIPTIKRGSLVKTGKSAGGRDINFIFYGKKNDLKRTANLSSALGAKDKRCFADKTGEDYRPTVFFVGSTHGGEFEGSVAILNLISILETGKDLKGDTNDFLYHAPERVNIMLIPFLNPDGRSHIEFKTMVGKTWEQLRYYNQGTWKDGSLCGWPDCKKVFPIKDHCDFLGGYYNDDGVNLMHDNFFGKKAAETEFLFEIAEEYAPDFTILLHGGTNGVNGILAPTYAPAPVRHKVACLEEAIKKESDKRNIPYYLMSFYRGEDGPIPVSFNLISALYHICGEPCITYESNQGLTECPQAAYTYEQIYDSHMILFEKTIKCVERGEE